MRKSFLITVFSIILIFFLILAYLSFYGIKTDKFNNLINERIKNIKPEISLKLSDVFLKLDLKKKFIKINTKNTKLEINNTFVELSEIEVSLDIIKFLTNKNSIKEIQIISKQENIKDVTNFLNSYRFNLPQFIFFNQIKSGKIKAKANIYFKEESLKDIKFKINGQVTDVNLNIFNKAKFNNINFDFNIKDKEYNFSNIKLKFEEIELESNKIRIVDFNEFFEISGDLKNKQSYINPNTLSKVTNLSLDFLEDKKIFAKTENEFSFKIDSNRAIKNLDLKSKINFDKVFTNKKLQNLIYLEDGVVNTKYSNNKLILNVESKYSFIEDIGNNINKDKNNFILNLTKKNNEDIEIEGKISNSKKPIDLQALFKIVKIDFDLISDKKISIESENQFAFKLDEIQKVKDLSIKSNLKFDKLYFNNKYQNLIFLEGGVVESTYLNKRLHAKIDSKYFFINDKYNNEKNKNNIKINLKKDNNKEIIVESFFNTKKNKINSKEFIKYTKIDQKLIKDQDIILDSENKITFSIDNKNKIKILKINSNLSFDKLKINYFSNKIKKIINNYNDQIILNNNFFEINYSDNKFQIKTRGKYSFENIYDNYEINLIKKKNKFNFNSAIELKNSLIKIDGIDYKKEIDIYSLINLKGSYSKDQDFLFENINFFEKKNEIKIHNLNLSKKYKLKNFDKLELNYFNKKNKLNYITISKINNKYELVGENFDGDKLVDNILKKDLKKSFLKNFKNLNSKIVISLDKIYIGNQSYLKNVQGTLTFKNNKIFSGNIESFLNTKNKFSLNIKTDSNNEKVTNLFIQSPEPFITRYNFIKGFKRGSLSYDSIEKNGLSSSRLKIYDFKIKEVPVLAKILTLASLQGISDLLKGEGIRVDEFDMEYENKNNLTTVKEIYAIGPSISLLMDGYIEENKLISLRGTLVPATTINKRISKIPLIGNILVGKKAGEGVFGVSFKIKGPPKKLNTTVNPIKSLTPRFITRTLKKLKGN